MTTKLNQKHGRDYATDLGFYVGDRVSLPDGRHAQIDEIVLRNVNEYEKLYGICSNATVVRIDDEYWLDSQLTRIG